MQTARFYGPNAGMQVNPRISVAQSTWAGGAATVTDPVVGGPSSQPTLVNDFTDGNWPGMAFYANADNWPTGSYGPYPAVPTTFVVALPDLSKFQVEAVGMSTISDVRAPRDIEVYVSLEDSGDVWQHVLSVDDMPWGGTAGYHEYDLASAVLGVQRVRFDVLRPWNTGPDWMGIPQAYMAELYVYGSQIPEPASLTTLAALAAAASLRRRRPR
ncbi:MAG: hypothetical protein BWZ02_00108 [Lentisphaerae bacterium ADurb.BinA184]|nr:MAG: hypothetical protein BWZ02_00108 [Lentisphaerae bacterium ADurb.BinA184]